MCGSWDILADMTDTCSSWYSAAIAGRSSNYDDIYAEHFPLSDKLRYDTRCYFNVRSKADISQLNLPHGTDN